MEPADLHSKMERLRTLQAYRDSAVTKELFAHAQAEANDALTIITKEAPASVGQVFEREQQIGTVRGLQFIPQLLDGNIAELREEINQLTKGPESEDEQLKV